MSTDKRAELQIDLVEKVTKQIITLCSGIIVILVTVLGYYYEYFGNLLIPWIWTILSASALFLVSIFFGLFVYGALISSIGRSEKLEDLDIYGGSIRYIAVLQWITFAIGLAFLLMSLYQMSVTPPTN